MTRTRAVALPVALALAVTAVSALAQDPAPARPPAGSLTDLTGVWTMLVEGHQFGLELEQNGSNVQGVMLAMGRRVLLVGSYVDRALTLKGERPEDGAGFSAGDQPAQAGPITATMKDDGTLEGELSSNRGRAKWTGQRLKAPQARQGSLARPGRSAPARRGAPGPRARVAPRA